MKHEGWVYHRSSLLTSVPALGVILVLCALCAAINLRGAVAALLLAFLLAGGARLWSRMALHNVSMQVVAQSDGVFPGQELTFDVKLHNGKLLPLVWLELCFPLDKTLCLLPEDTRAPDELELAALREQGLSEKLVGEKRLPFCAWYETMTVSSRWSAERRGIYNTSCWSLRTGDGFGLTQVERAISASDAGEYAVYPALVPVCTDLFLRSLWNVDTGSRGMLQDTTLIRSTRSYQSGDNLKHINWRLTARSLPLTVNVYEDIQPRSIHFLLDGESFGGENAQWDALEDALSILGSELVALNEAKMNCGITLCRGTGAPIHVPGAENNLRELLRALAAYQPAQPVKDEKTNQVIRQTAVFPRERVLQSLSRVGRFYYITRDCESLTNQPLLQYLDSTVMTILTWEHCKAFGDYETVSLRTLRKGETA